jgi:hypothetical protein
LNQEYVLPASPGIARQIVRLAAISNTEIAPAITSLAEAGLLHEQDFARLGFNATKEEKQTIQQLLDYEHRAVVVSEQAVLARRAILGSALLVNAFPIVVATWHRGEWAILARRFGLTVTEKTTDDTSQILILSPTELIDHEVINRRRHGLLIMDAHTEGDRFDVAYQGQGPKHHGPAREFPRTVIICPVGRQLLPQIGWGSRAEQQVAGAVATIFPTAPLACINPPQAERARLGMFESLQERGFVKYRPVDTYFMFNVITDLLKFKMPEEDYYPKDEEQLISSDAYGGTDDLF